MKKILLLIILVLIFLSNGAVAFAFNADIYNEQLEASGANELTNKIPEDTAEYLDRLDISPGNVNVSLQDISDEITYTAAEASTDVLAVFGCIAGLIIVSALLGSVCESTKSLVMRNSISVCSGAAICIVIAAPIAQYISDSAQIIEKCCIFNEAFIPIYGGIMAAAGQTTTAASYSTFMLAALEGASFAVSNIALPLLRAVMAFSLTSALSQTLRLGSVIKLFEQYLKWILGFIAVMIVGLIGVGTTASSAMDGAVSRAAKYIISSSVPVLGSAMGEALSSVRGCVNILRTSVGSFGIITMTFILLPSLIKGVLWQLCLNICALIADLLGVRQIKELTDSVGRVVSVMIAIIIFTATLTIFTLAVMLGRGV